METIQYPKRRSIGAGIAGGIAGGAAMYGIMSGLMASLGMGPNCFAIIMGMITGQSYAAALGPGIAAHFGTSAAIGAIFGAVTSTKKLQLTGFPKGIGLGIATGVIAYVVIFLPIATTVMPSHMMDLMKMMPMSSTGGNMGMSENNMMNQSSMSEKSSSMGSNSMNQQGAMNGSSEMQGSSMNGSSAMQGQSQMNEKSAMQSGMSQQSSMNGGGNMMNDKMKMEEMNKMMMDETQKMIPSILGGALAGHIVFGAVLGVVATAIVRVSRR